MKRSRNYLLLFIGINFICILWPLLVTLGLHSDSLVRGSLTKGAGPFLILQIFSLVFLFAAIYRFKRHISSKWGSNMLWTDKLFGVFLVILLLWGIIRGNGIYFIFSDFYVYIVIFGFLILGRYDQIWELMYKPMLILFWFAVVLILFGLMMSGKNYWYTGEFGAVSFKPYFASRFRWSVAYDLRPLLKFWPILFALSYTQAKWNLWKLIGLGTFLADILLNGIIFKFRSMVLIDLLQIAMVVLVVPLTQKKLKIGMVYLALTILSLTFFAVQGTEAYESLMSRFYYSDMYDYRIRELKKMVTSLNPANFIVGKGMGGTYHPPLDVHGGRLVTFPGVHIGIFTPLLKGGVFFLILYLSFFCRMFIHKSSKWFQNKFNIVALSVLPVFFLSQLIIPMPGMESIFSVILMGLTCSRMTSTVSRPIS